MLIAMGKKKSKKKRVQEEPRMAASTAKWIGGIVGALIGVSIWFLYKGPGAPSWGFGASALVVGFVGWVTGQYIWHYENGE